MDWGTLIFAALGVAFVVLVVLAIRRMAAGRPELAEPDEEESKKDKKKQKVTPETRPAGPALDTGEETRRLSRGLKRTRGGFIARISDLIRGRSTLDPEILDQVEEILFTADIGVKTSQDLIDRLREELGRGEVADPSAIWGSIKARSREMLRSQDKGGLDVRAARPFVMLVIGVNGVGKTTTIGKLAARYKDQGLEVMLAAGDTFRAAAVEQLAIWGERAGCEVAKGPEQADPTSVVVGAAKRAREQGVDLLIADTAGRLHTKVDLMEELKKVHRSLGKHVPGAPHETLLVLDATTGQNAIAQARLFKEALDVTGLVLTKLDGTAKGGVVLGICNELSLPVRFVGIGEKQEDLRVFDPDAFVEALYASADTE